MHEEKEEVITLKEIIQITICQIEERIQKDQIKQRHIKKEKGKEK